MNPFAETLQTVLDYNVGGVWEGATHFPKKWEIRPKGCESHGSSVRKKIRQFVEMVDHAKPWGWRQPLPGKVILSWIQP
ncbi:MAG: hypothetical protein HQL73_10675 [Magnetococcales bacterium]|nr:hypothetical protein [Magnetococcales bacterium]